MGFGFGVAIISSVAEPELGRRVVGAKIHHTCHIHRINMSVVGGLQEVFCSCFFVVTIVVAVALEHA